ncbi:MAG: hypothetical protein IJS46_06640, partial [Kiritimatiellae bacterium]|nr:hypothetical protein [Kiritimatiellia bacterium]
MSDIAEILADVKTHLEIEIQAGRRRQPLDPSVLAAFDAPPPRRPAPPPVSAASGASAAEKTVPQQPRPVASA